MAILPSLSSAALFAGTTWDAADAIADSSAGLVPAVSEITYTEDNGYGVTIYEDTATLLIQENSFGWLNSRFIGDYAIKDLMDIYTD